MCVCVCVCVCVWVCVCLCLSVCVLKSSSGYTLSQVHCCRYPSPLPPGATLLLDAKGNSIEPSQCGPHVLIVNQPFIFAGL